MYNWRAQPAGRAGPGQIGAAGKTVVMSRADPRFRYRYLLIATVVLLSSGSFASGQRVLERADYLDKLRGMWFGQLIGNHTGRPFEGQYTTREAAPNSAFAWAIKTDPGDPWTGDDDTFFEVLDLHVLETFGVHPIPANIRDEWLAHVTFDGIYIANLQARFLMDAGFTPPDTGSYRWNVHAYAIDSQITTESLGAWSPGMRQWAIDATATFGGASNEGFALHAAQFYAAMYAAAALESNVPTLIALGQESIPTTSRTWKAVQAVRDWHAQDLQDGRPDWRATRRLIYDHYVGDLALGRYRGWIESTVNVALTTLALLYGAGDFEETVRISVLSGYDADCNAAAAGGLIGMMLGFDALPATLTANATDAYRILYLQGLPAEETITGLATRFQTVGEQVIVDQGGSVGGTTYTLPTADPVTPAGEKPDPAGPAGLVGGLLAVGGSITVDASLVQCDPTHDRRNLSGIIDGITDVTYNGHLPYWTNDGANPQPAGGDFYALRFSRRVRVDRVVFYEGDLVWSSINANPRTTPPRGGYFTNLTAEYDDGGGWQATTGMTLSEPPGPYACYQRITLTFDPVWTEAVRIRGTAGGLWEFTTIVELEAYGALVRCDFDGDLDVDQRDFEHLAACWLGSGVPGVGHCRDSDLDGDNDVDLTDFARFQRCYSGAGNLADPACFD